MIQAFDIIFDDHCRVFFKRRESDNKSTFDALSCSFSEHTFFDTKANAGKGVHVRTLSSSCPAFLSLYSAGLVIALAD